MVPQRLLRYTVVKSFTIQRAKVVTWRYQLTPFGGLDGCMDGVEAMFPCQRSVNHT
jgi:hypothetical protein